MTSRPPCWYRVPRPRRRFCWIAGKGGTVLRTTDGEHWERLARADEGRHRPDHRLERAERDLQNDEGERFSTNDGGQTWAKV